jgi:programmed cell death 6-interacting protein
MYHSDLSLPPLSNLHINQNAQPQQAQTYNTRATKAPLVPAPQPSYSSQHQHTPQQLHSENDIPAPVPTRTVPVANMTAGAAGGHVVNTWNPEMGIKFGGNGGLGNAMAVEGRSPGWMMANGGQPGSAGANMAGNQTWDPTKGFKFG